MPIKEGKCDFTQKFVIVSKKYGCIVNVLKIPILLFGIFKKSCSKEKTCQPNTGSETMQKRSKSGVLMNKDFRDSLIIDKYDTEFLNWREKKLDQLRSENSEDAMTWNVFRSLRQINPSHWLPQLFKQSFHQDLTYPAESIDITLWKKLNPPLNLTTREGQSEVDVIIESNEFVWFIEAKYKSDISLATSHDKSRNQIIRNIDIGLDYKNGKEYYFSLLILNE
jgi:hypothetical protein